MLCGRQEDAAYTKEIREKAQKLHQMIWRWIWAKSWPKYEALFTNILLKDQERVAQKWSEETLRYIAPAQAKVRWKWAWCRGYCYWWCYNSVMGIDSTILPITIFIPTPILTFRQHSDYTSSFFGEKIIYRYDYPFQDPTLPWDTRVQDLVGRLTVDEIVAQMSHGGAQNNGISFTRIK